MAQIKLLGLRVLRQIRKRILAGEKSTTIAADYEVSAGHIRKLKLAIMNPESPNGRWKEIMEKFQKEDDERNGVEL